MVNDPSQSGAGVSLPPAPPTIEPGYDTTEFWLVVVTDLGIVVASIVGHPVVNPDVSLSLATLLAMGYGALRTWRKNG